MILELVILLFVFILTYYILFRKKKVHKKIIFTGYRQTGKTKAINFLLGENFKTVPTLEPYEVQVKKCVIREQVFEEKEQLDQNAKILFFIKDNKDVAKLVKNFVGYPNINFVMYKKCKEQLKNVMYLDEDPTKLKLMI